MGNAGCISSTVPHGPFTANPQGIGYGEIILSVTQRLHSSSFLGLPYRILNMTLGRHNSPETRNPKPAGFRMQRPGSVFRDFGRARVRSKRGTV